MGPASQIRRVVLGADADGVTVMRSDGPAPAVVELPAVPGTSLVDLWRSDSVPLDPTETDDPTTAVFSLMPSGSLYRVIDLGPTGDGEPMWHRTDSIDFIYIARGSARCLFDGGSVELHEGDTIVLQAVRHAWVNPSDHLCRLIDVSIATTSASRTQDDSSGNSSP